MKQVQKINTHKALTEGDKVTSVGSTEVGKLGELFPAERPHGALSDDALHQAMLGAREKFAWRCRALEQEVVQFIDDALAPDLAALVPLAEEIIRRIRHQGFKRQGENATPTVEQYFKDIKLNYSTVRGWFHRHPELRQAFKTTFAPAFWPGRPKRLTPFEKAITETFQSGGDVSSVVQNYIDQPQDNAAVGDKEPLALQLVVELEKELGSVSVPARAILAKLKSVLAADEVRKAA